MYVCVCVCVCIYIYIYIYIYTHTGTQVTVKGLMPTQPPLLFAVSTKDRCAQSMPYGPDDNLLTDTFARRKKFGANVDAFFSTKHKDAMHSAWLQKFYKCPSATCTTGGVLLFEIFWSFDRIKSLKSRFVDATDEWDDDGEPVTFTVTTPGGQEIIKRGHWRFSAKANSIDYLSNVFDSQVCVNVYTCLVSYM
jgi:hypothetical protein